MGEEGEEEEEAKEEEEDLDLAEQEEEVSDAESDNDTVVTNDTVATDDTTDSLFDTAKDPNEEVKEVKVNKKVRVPENLQDLVKQDFKKIVTSVTYEDEDRFLGGKKTKKKVKKTVLESGEEKNSKVGVEGVQET